MPLFDAFLTKGFKVGAQDREGAKDVVLNGETNLDVRSVDFVAERVKTQQGSWVVVTARVRSGKVKEIFEN